MPSLHEVCRQSPAVVLDAASGLVQVGIVQGDGQGRWESSSDESGVALFECLRRLEVSPNQVETWIFCDGPGSILGVRTAAMALRTWGVLRRRPVYTYVSLALVAHAMEPRDIGVIADARRDTWHYFSVSGGLQRLTTEQLAGNLVMPENFRHWSSPPAGVTRVPYVLSTLLPQVCRVDLLRATEAPDAFLHEEPRYLTWTPQIHRAPEK